MDILEALEELNPENEEQWTADGLPLVEVMQELTGNKELTRQEITDVNPEFCRDKAKVRNDAPPPDNPHPPGLKEEAEEEVTKRDLDQQIAELQGEHDLLETRIDELQKMRDYLQEKEYGTSTPKADTAARLAFIKSQRELREQKSARSHKIVEALGGPDKVDPRSQLDQAMARKTKRGTQRPGVQPTT